MSPDSTNVGPREKCLRCGATLLAAQTFCQVCLERDLGIEASLLFDPLQSFGGSLAGSEFTVLEEIGHGGMGVVFRARQQSPPRDVAVKVLQPHLLASADIRRRLLAEAAAMAELNHPGILPLYASGERDGQPWLAMKYAPGGTLSARRGEWTGKWREISELVAGLADAVQHAHERGLIHRDVKPGNVLFDETGRACLVDFGLVKWRDSDAGETLTHAMLGTPAYLAPEVALSGASAATTASDIYGLGAILYELVSGRPPFKSQSNARLLQSIATEEPAALRDVAAGVPRDLEVVCLKAMAKTPSARYDSAAALAADLRRWLEGRIILARPVSFPARLVRWSRRHPLPATLAAALVLAVVTGGTAAVLQYRALKTALSEMRSARAAAEDRIIFMSEHLVPTLESVGRLDVMEKVFEDMEGYYAKFGNSSDASGVARQADVWTQWAQVLRKQGKGAEARRKLGAAVSMVSGAAGLPGAGVEVWVVHTSVLRRSGEHAISEHDYAGAVRFIDEAIETAGKGLRLYKENLALRVELADAFLEKVEALRGREQAGDMEASLAALDTAVSQWRSLVEETSARSSPFHLRCRRQLAYCLYEKGRFSLRSRDSAGALESFQQSHALREELAAESADNPEERRLLATACNRVGHALFQFSREQHEDPPLEEAGRMFRQQEAIMEKLVQRDPGNLRWRAEWGLSALANGLLAFESSDFADSLRWLDETEKRLQPVPASVLFTVTGSRAWAKYYIARLSDDGTQQKPMENAERALELSFESAKADPLSRDCHSQWTEIFLWTVENPAGRLEPALFEAFLKRWLDRVNAESAVSGSSPWWRLDAARVHRRLAELYSSGSRTDDAIAANREAFRLRAGVLADEPRVPRDLITETERTATQLLEAVKSENDRVLVAEGLARCAPALETLQPTGHWRHIWARRISRAVRELPEAKRRAQVEAARGAIYPALPPRQWSADEQKGLDLLNSVLSPQSP